MVMVAVMTVVVAMGRAVMVVVMMKVVMMAVSTYPACICF